ncbi:hypothetical protein [Corallococcus llansteffanensis]|uniref:Peptidase C58 YopT-type domain-containing protein n=1 Tax=Corallococcus llansteffanensis TaxID=2316731 RepID=A0A3A8PWQ5_9BACT|nr:hypothetical protein [Corallococcus llansteffanensis]RKH56802.1 hypothetical protein D7V93_19600 [Corallococcus llansteffanensis]
MKSSFKPSFPKTPKAPAAPPKLDNTLAQGKTSTGSQPVSKPTAPAKTTGPDKTPQGDSFKKPGANAEASSSSSRPNINAHDLQGPQVQAPKLSESEVQDLAMGRTPGKGRPATVRPEIQKVAEEMKAEVPGSEILRFTDQGGHPMLKKPGLPSGTDAGVCSAMTSEWIRTGIEAGGDPKKGSQAFGKLNDNHFGSFIDKQHAESLQGDAIKHQNNANLSKLAGIDSKLEKLRETQAQRNGLTEKLTDPDLSPKERQALKQQRAELTQDLKQGMAEVKEESASVAAKQAELEKHTHAFRKERGGGNDGVHVQDYEPIQSDFPHKLHAATQQDGHYRVGLRKDGDSAEGHVIGLHKTDGKSRLMDANTAEWQTNSHKDLVNLTAEHIERLYPNYSAFDVTRYG